MTREEIESLALKNSRSVKNIKTKTDKITVANNVDLDNLVSQNAAILQQKGTTATPTFNVDGSIDIVYKDASAVTVRTDSITFGENTITEVKTVGTNIRTTVINTSTLVAEVS